MSIPSEEFLRQSEAHWKKVHTEFQAELETLRDRESHWYWHWQNLMEHRSPEDAHRKAAWQDYHAVKLQRLAVEAQRNEASENLFMRREQLKHYEKKADLWTPKIVGWNVSKIAPRGVFGPLGPEKEATTHYAASPRARNLAEGLSLMRGFNRFHAGKGWGGLSYYACIPDTGEILLGRSTYHKGAHVLGRNYGNYGINFFCTAGHKPTEAQALSFLWLIAHAHTDALPARHRTDLDLRKATIRGHNQWPGQSTRCPGFFTPENLRRIGA